MKNTCGTCKFWESWRGLMMGWCKESDAPKCQSGFCDKYQIDPVLLEE